MTMKGELFSQRASYSKMRLDELRKKLQVMPELDTYQALTIFGVGSYARLEASEYSDIDMFFLISGQMKEHPRPKTRSLQLFGKMIKTIDDMGFPEFSNDCQYLTLLHTKDILEHLGSPRDDHENYFTARMLLLLESHCLYGEADFKDITEKIVESYFRDFPDHSQTYQPIFLLNDICRFWKTLLLNYEHKRNTVPPQANEEERKTKQKVKNFKLKYSRMTTCFASIAAIGSHCTPVTVEQVISLTKLTPRQRLEVISSNIPELAKQVDEVLEKYAEFLWMTGQPTQKLEAQFSDKTKRIEMFQKANNYGDAMYSLLQAIDEKANSNLLRYLVI